MTTVQKIREPMNAQVSVEGPVCWFDGTGCGPWMVNMQVRASWIGHATVSFAPTGEPDPHVPMGDREIYGGPMMSSDDARKFAAALVKAADLADAQVAAGKGRP